MRLIPLDSLTEGSRLGVPIHGTGGTLLLARGVAVTSEHIQSLRRRGFSRVYIEDEQTCDIQPTSLVSEATRSRAASDLSTLFSDVSRRLEPLREVKLDQVKPNHPDFRSSLRRAVDPGALWEATRCVDLLIEDLSSASVISGLGSLRCHDAYTFEHSVDVTIAGLLLAKKARWDLVRLRSFGIGLLLHDIGKLFVEPELLRQDSGLTEEQFAQIRHHPELGYTLIREVMPALGPLPAHVAWQHHERQDGTGYPRGLRGPNYLGHSPPGLIHEFGSIAAVADVYDALASDRPYRPAYPQDQAVRLICSLAGTHLNRAAVELFRTTVAPYPVCSQVQVTAGRHAGCQGVVAHVSPARLDRPRVRILRDGQGNAMEPFELDLAADRSAQIACLGPAPTPQPGDRPASRAA